MTVISTFVGQLKPGRLEDAIAMTRQAAKPLERHGARAAAYHAEGAAQAALLRCLFGNPFRPGPQLDPVWLAWKDGTVARLARSVSEGGAFGLMPVLGDALEDAGCADAALLGHCRSAGPHARGCWVVDLLLAGPPPGG